MFIASYSPRAGIASIRWFPRIGGSTSNRAVYAPQASSASPIFSDSRVPGPSNVHDNRLGILSCFEASIVALREAHRRHRGLVYLCVRGGLYRRERDNLFGPSRSSDLSIVACQR